MTFYYSLSRFKISPFDINGPVGYEKVSANLSIASDLTIDSNRLMYILTLSFILNVLFYIQQLHLHIIFTKLFYYYYYCFFSILFKTQ